MAFKIKGWEAKSAGKAATPKVGLQRLERLAGILEAAHKRYKKLGAIFKEFDADGVPEYEEWDNANNRAMQIEGYDQCTVGHACGTPACAIGHYAVNTPQRWGWDPHGDVRVAADFAADFGSDAWTVQAGHEFCLSGDDGPYTNEPFRGSEVDQIFGHQGCNKAKTAFDAARYIQKFVAKKRKALGLKKPRPRA